MAKCSLKGNRGHQVKRIRILLAAALLVLVSVVYLIHARYQAVALDLPLPAPNGYDQFVKAAKMIEGDASAFATMSEPELAALIVTNRQALDLAHSAFTNKCRVPIHELDVYSVNQTFVWTGAQNLATCMMAKGRLAELQNHSAEAAKDYLEVMRFGTESGRGGFMLDALIGIKIEGLAQGPLERLLPRLDAESCRSVASELETLDSNRQDFGNVFDREQLFHGQKLPGFNMVLSPNFKTFFTSFRLWIEEFLGMRKHTAELRKAAGDQFREKQFESRVLAVKFAARAYELDKGRPPSNIHDLAPNYLRAVPRDPDSGKEMVYPLR